MQITKQIPNLFTLINLFLGCCAIVFALQSQSLNYTDAEGGGVSISFPESMAKAAIFIFIAAVVDFLDGFVARLLNATSEMGKQLDSLSDVVSFGVAPSIILYQLLRLSSIRETGAFSTYTFYYFVAFLFACAAAYRLGKFNIDVTQSQGFKGVPTPAAGLLVASFPLIIHYGVPFFNLANVIVNKWFLLIVIFGVSLLMISKLQLIALKFKNFSVADNLPKYILAVIAIITAILFKWLAVPIVFIAYIILSLLFKSKN
jgi:CDP-diacylglycerol---serine O-phosphatidyltransferase